MCACHPCAGAMLIFSVSFQFKRMISFIDFLVLIVIAVIVDYLLGCLFVIYLVYLAHCMLCISCLFCPRLCPGNMLYIISVLFRNAARDEHQIQFYMTLGFHFSIIYLFRFLYHTLSFICFVFLSFGNAAREFQEIQFAHKPRLGIPTSSL